jgi:hypothetical protein
MRTIYLTPHTHYDVAWAFSKEEYLKINEAIVDEALKLMESAEFKFYLEQTFLLKEIVGRNPALFKRQVETVFYRLEVDDETSIVKIFNNAGNLLVSGNEIVIEDKEKSTFGRHNSGLFPNQRSSSPGPLNPGEANPPEYQILWAGLI